MDAEPLKRTNGEKNGRTGMGWDAGGKHQKRDESEDVMEVGD
jgi:hypothetical protein